MSRRKRLKWESGPATPGLLGRIDGEVPGPMTAKQQEQEVRKIRITATTSKEHWGPEISEAEEIV